MNRILSLSTLCLVLACSAAAQQSRSVNGGILNGKAVSLPKPEYPEAQRTARIGGMIAVDVLIDENGEVISATAEVNEARDRRDAAGEKLPGEPADPFLREAAENAARKARFSPTLLSGVPVRVKGKLLYNFVADNSDQPARVGEIYGRWLNPEAIFLPQPAYPAAAMAVKAEGSVTVMVTFDAEGNITAAEATSGHPLLRAAAVEAAKHAKIRPLTTGTQDKGVLEYRFVIPQP